MSIPKIVLNPVNPKKEREKIAISTKIIIIVSLSSNLIFNFKHLYKIITINECVVSFKYITKLV